VRLPSGEVFQGTALGEAAAKGQLEAARLLLDAGADPSLADGDGSTPLMAAAGEGQLEVLRLLLARCAAVDAVDGRDLGWTAFHTACYHGQPECAEALARAGCDVGLKNSDGRTGRELAEGRGHAAVVERLRAVVAEQLLAAQAVGPAPAPEPTAVVGDGGPADHLLGDAVRKGNRAAVARRLAAGADPNASVTGRTPSGEVVQTTVLAVAAGHGRLEAARLLLEGGADPSLAGGEGFTPLMAAARNGQLEVLRLLLGRGAAVDAVGPTERPSAKCPRFQGSVTAFGEGWTAFQTACFNNPPECVEALARAGCDVGVKANDGKTGQQLAEAQGSREVARRLRALARQPFVGVLVELAGLVGAAEHNGKLATVRCRTISFSLHHLCFFALCTMSSKNHSCAWRLNGIKLNWPHHPRVVLNLGAALPAREAPLHAGAAGAAGRGRRHGAAHGRAAGELCAEAPAGRHAVRPGQEAALAPTAAVRCCSLSQPRLRSHASDPC
jgi:ankyrin repeat protein